ncbi:flagellar hook-associated protein 3 FlgL [Granulicella rosea]|uniref:Flagellar hook-associated protein 3 FlgL n=1 Tax=Granulicella rosea TaxID=474952 RepID=A0A239H5Q0_9BACT|nr:flagellar hook-associated protein FlgL [Granulicella rosea]SNS75594.1 flagellar hook-associated protein 3 FlgL [Granulicella rosea]
MRVDPNYITNLSGSLSQSSYAEQQLTNELSSGLRIAQLSDDPVAAAQNALFSNAINRLDSFTQSSTTEQGKLQVADSTLGQVVTQITSAISLATSAGNGTLNASNLSSIATELGGIRDQVLSLANTSYQGQYLFSGSQGSTEPFTLNGSTTPTTVTYNGDSLTQSVQTPAGQSIQVNVPGSAIFTNPSANLLGTLNQLITDVAAGNNTAVAADSTNLSAALTNVSTQRAVLDSSLSQLTSTSTYATTQATQLTAQQSALISADPATVATQLQTAEVQHQALLSVISAVGKSDLFSYIQ